MNKKEMLDLLRLLSALESWALSRKDGPLPEYLHDEISASVALLEKGILGDEKPDPPYGWSAERHAKYLADVAAAGGKK